LGRRSIKSEVTNQKIKRGTFTRLDEAKTPTEIAHKQQMAVILKIATFTPTQIAEALGERKSTIRAWFKEPKVQKQYENGIKAISTAAKQLLETLTIEAVKELGSSLTSADPRHRQWAVEQILDRGGIPKSRREESTGDSKKVVEHRVTDKEGNDLRDKLIGASPEVYDEASKGIQKIEDMLRKNA